jgi:hypothetical protein
LASARAEEEEEPLSPAAEGDVGAADEPKYREYGVSDGDEVNARNVFCTGFPEDGADAIGKSLFGLAVAGVSDIVGWLLPHLDDGGDGLIIGLVPLAAVA